MRERYPNLQTAARPRGSSRAAGNVTAGIGIGVDVVQAGVAFSGGDTRDTLTGIQNTASAGLGIVGMGIASSNPGSAAIVAIATVIIGVEEERAMKRIDASDRQNVRAHCQRRSEIFGDALRRLDELESQLRSNCCN